MFVLFCFERMVPPDSGDVNVSGIGKGPFNEVLADFSIWVKVRHANHTRVNTSASGRKITAPAEPKSKRDPKGI